MKDLITIIGPTASGKTTFAAKLAYKLDAEIISGDSRQLYRGMDLGTGKDLEDYFVQGKQIPHHLIDICDAGYKYNVFEFQHDFLEAYQNIKSRDKLPILCGGTGMYIESVLKGYKLLAVPEDAELRKQLENHTLEQLAELLRGYKNLHNVTDVDTVKRAIRAIEIEEFYKKSSPEQTDLPKIESLIIGISINRELRRSKISKRLRARLAQGMIDEVQMLIEKGISPEDLIYYGLEYKYLTLYITGELSYEQMVDQLEVAIHQFAKRQMTWFRGMERRGFQINWIDAQMPDDEKIECVSELCKKEG